jgi:hypothetical protein
MRLIDARPLDSDGGSLQAQLVRKMSCEQGFLEAVCQGLEMTHWFTI